MASTKPRKQRATSAAEQLSVSVTIEEGERTADWESIWRTLLLKPRSSSDTPHMAPGSEPPAPSPDDEEGGDGA